MIKNEFDAGKLNARMRLYSPSLVVDGQGGRMLNYQDQGHIWAYILKQGPSRVVESEGRETGRAQATIRIRYRSDISPNWRLELDERFFRITATMVPDHRRHFLDLYTEEDKR